MWYVYFLKSRADDHWLYVGSTNNLKFRVKQHQAGEVESTKPYRPLVLEGYIAVKTEKQARRLERYLKVGSGKTILRKRILGEKKPLGDEVVA